jgi:hypothetical protein
MIVSDTPPKNPASAPRSTPMTSEMKVAMKPMRSDTRAPYTTRLNTSRPMSSVPNQWSADGGLRNWSVRSVMP